MEIPMVESWRSFVRRTISRWRSYAADVLTVEHRRRLTRWSAWPPVGFVRFGSLRRLHPISRTWGADRGKPVDRYYIEQFLKKHEHDIRGHVLEIGTDKYTRSFGGGRVDRSDVLHVAERREGVTILGDLTNATHLPEATYDTVILTQTLNMIFDVSAALATVHRILKPGGVTLVTVPGISQISRYDMDRWGHFWSFTTASAERLFTKAFPEGRVSVEARGNVLAAVSFLHGISSTELRKKELEHSDPDYQLIIVIRAEKASDDA
jgi:SAM-dependent methyltransferase